jgi:hypothetical protein
MTVDERKRHALYRRLETLLGDDHADTVMELLPPVGWADVATRHDLQALEARMATRLEAVEARLEAVEVRLEARVETGFAELRAELHQALRQQVWAILGVLVVALAVSEALARLA